LPKKLFDALAHASVGKQTHCVLQDAMHLTAPNREAQVVAHDVEQRGSH
jgi:hypothetical protein